MRWSRKGKRRKGVLPLLHCCRKRKKAQQVRIRFPADAEARRWVGSHPQSWGSWALVWLNRFLFIYLFFTNFCPSDTRTIFLPQLIKPPSCLHSPLHWKKTKPHSQQTPLPTLRGKSVLRGRGRCGEEARKRTSWGGGEGGGGGGRKKKNERGNCSVGRNPPSPFPVEEVD